MFKEIKKIIEQEIKKPKKTKDQKTFTKIKKTWEEKIEKKTKKNTIVYDFTKGVLTLKTTNPSWRNEINFQKENIKKN